MTDEAINPMLLALCRCDLDEPLGWNPAANLLSECASTLTDLHETVLNEHGFRRETWRRLRKVIPKLVDVACLVAINAAEQPEEFEGPRRRRKDSGRAGEIESRLSEFDLD